MEDRAKMHVGGKRSFVHRAVPHPFRAIAVHRTIESEHRASTALADLVRRFEIANQLTPTSRPRSFFASTSCNITLSKTQIRHQLLQPTIFLFQQFQALNLQYTEPAILLLPAVGRSARSKPGPRLRLLQRKRDMLLRESTPSHRHSPLLEDLIVPDFSPFRWTALLGGRHVFAHPRQSMRVMSVR